MRFLFGFLLAVICLALVPASGWAHGAPDGSSTAFEQVVAPVPVADCADYDGDGCTAMACQACPTCAGALLATFDRNAVLTNRCNPGSETGNRRLVGLVLEPEPFPPRS